MNTQNKDQIIEQLQKENESLRRIIQVSSNWMKKEVQGQMLKISKRKVGSLTDSLKENFIKENQEEIITKRIQDYFGEILLLNAPAKTIEYLVISEINFFNMQKSTNLDGFNVVASYHKIFDALIEQFITNNFRKYCQKNGIMVLRVNDPLEKALHLVITKKYILGVGRVYGLIKSIKNGDKLNNYGLAFKAYLEKNPDLNNLLLDDGFYGLFTKIMNSEVFGAKRHSGKIDFEDTKIVRNLIVGDYTDKNSLFYKFLEAQSVMF